MRGRRSANAGFALVWMVLSLPALVAFLGLVLDGGILFLRSQQLDSATDAASLAATDAWDRHEWMWNGRVRIDPDHAKRLALDYLAKNMPGARLMEFQVRADTEVYVRTETTVPFFFLRIFGWTERTVTSYSTAARGTKS